ncbi:MAG TPA: polysaccharide deacetylase family protein [Chitinophagaceae bacterium]|nr:polysaccharide deacetylase family protein [Chitinophagaceae bacterium]
MAKTPWWLKKIYPSLTWDIPAHDREIYLTFDDGPHETATPFVLNLLKQYNAKATFFCIGSNVVKNPAIYGDMLLQGHTAGNHTYNHLNGWKTPDKDYIDNIALAAKPIHSGLFRPPYGRISRFQAKLLQQGSHPFKIIMWTVLSGDFDTGISPQQCLHNVTKHAKPGSIIVFHDSAKAYQRLAYALPRALDYFSKEGYIFKAVT